jgi:hypothetical protein
MPFCSQLAFAAANKAVAGWQEDSDFWLAELSALA